MNRLLACMLLTGAVAACDEPEDPTPMPVPGEVAVTVTSPAPGAELLAAETPMIRVAGTVTTTSTGGALEAFVNGERVLVAADGSFSVDVMPEVGINHLKVDGGDGLGTLAGTQLDVLWAPDYLATNAGTTGFDLAAALELRLGQRFFDSRLLGTDLDLSTSPVVASDLAQVLELVLWHVDLAGLLPGGIQFGEGSAMLDVQIPAVEPGQIIVDAKIRDLPGAAVDLDIDLLGVFLQMDGTFAFSGSTLAIAGGIQADMRATARLTLGRNEDGSIRVAVASVDASVGPLVPMFAGPDGEQLNAFITLGASDFRSVVEGLIVEQLVPAFTDNVPPLLESLLGATNQVLQDVTFTLDPGLGTAVTLNLDGAIGGLDVLGGPPLGSNPGHVTVRQDLTIRTTNAAVHPGSRGAPRIEAAPVRPSGAAVGLHLALRQDLLNALLHALWNGGLLEAEAQLGGIAAQVSAKLPPVARPTPLASDCALDGERCDLLLQLGQIEVTLDDFGQRFVLSATAGARLEVSGGTVSIKIQQEPTVIAWETTAGVSPGTLTPEAVEGLVKELVWPELVGAIGENLSITLPLPDLATLGLGELAPGLADAMLELALRQRPTVTGGYLGLGANLELAAPQP